VRAFVEALSVPNTISPRFAIPQQLFPPFIRRASAA
jgi:hypothetical protein